MLIYLNSNPCFDNNVYHLELPCIVYAKIKCRKNVGDLQYITLPLNKLCSVSSRENLPVTTDSGSRTQGKYMPRLINLPPVTIVGQRQAQGHQTKNNNVHACLQNYLCIVGSSIQLI